MNDCNSYDDFDHIFLCQLDKHVPRKKQWIRGNTKPHVNNKLGTSIVKRSRLKNKTNKYIFFSTYMIQINKQNFFG